MGLGAGAEQQIAGRETLGLRLLLALEDVLNIAAAARLGACVGPPRVIHADVQSPANRLNGESDRSFLADFDGGILRGPDTGCLTTLEHDCVQTPTALSRRTFSDGFDVVARA